MHVVVGAVPDVLLGAPGVDEGDDVPRNFGGIRHFIEGELLAANEVDAQGMHERTLGGLLNGSIGRLDFFGHLSLPYQSKNS